MTNEINLIVESAELVMNSFGSLGCHAQDVISLTCPLQKTQLATEKQNVAATDNVFFISRIYGSPLMNVNLKSQALACTLSISAMRMRTALLPPYRKV